MPLPIAAIGAGVSIAQGIVGTISGLFGGGRKRRKREAEQAAYVQALEQKLQQQQKRSFWDWLFGG